MSSIAAANEVRPLIVDRKGAPLSQEDGILFSGCYVNVLIDIWAQDNQYGKGLRAKLMGLQFVKTGEAFGGGRQANANDFGSLGDDEGDATDLV